MVANILVWSMDPDALVKSMYSRCMFCKENLKSSNAAINI